MAYTSFRDFCVATQLAGEDQFDEWMGTPNVCGVYQFPYPTSSGKAVLLSLPLHNGYDPLLDGNNNFQDFLEHLLSVEFAE